MAQAAPKTKGEELLDRMREIISLSEAPSEFVLRSIMRDAESLKKVDAAVAYMVLCLAAAIEKDEAGVYRNGKNAVALAPSNYVVLGNFGLALHRIGQLTDAFEYTKKAYELAPTDPNANEWMVTLSMDHGQVRNAHVLLEDRIKQLDASSPELPVVKKWRDGVGQLINEMEEIGIPEELLLHYLPVARKIACAKGVAITGFRSSVVREDSQEGQLDWVLHIPASVDVGTVVEMNFELADTLAEDDELSHEDSWKVVTRFSRQG